MQHFGVSNLGKFIGFLILAIVALAIVGLIVRALRWLLTVALVIVVVGAIVGALASRKET